MNDAQKRFVLKRPLATFCWEHSVMFPDTFVHIRISEAIM